MARARHRSIPFLLLAITLLACSATGTSQSTNQASGQSQNTSGTTLKRATVTIKGDPPTLSAAVDQAGSGGTDGLSELEQLVHVGLAAVDVNGDLTPRLAEAVPSVENGLWTVFPDGRMQTTWRLVDGARWQDGTPLTTQDLLFTAKVAQDHIVPLYRDRAFDNLDSLDAPDARTLVATWSQPFIGADTLFSSTGLSRVLPMPEHILGRAYDEDRATFNQLPYWSAEFVGAGPFKLKEWTLGSYMVLSANDVYALGRPKLDEVEARFILDPSTIVANALAGAVDVTMGRGVSLEQALQAKDQWGDKGRIDAALLSWTALFPQFMNPTPSQVAELPFREALMHALDRQELSNSLQAGYSPVADTLFAPGAPEYRDVESSIVTYTYDPSRATALLESMGLTRASSGELRDSAGQHVTLEVRTTKDDLRERLIYPIGDYWQKVGIGMDPVIIATQAANDRAYRATFLSFELTRQPAELERYRSSGVPTSENGFRGSNRVRYVNPDFDAMLDRYFTTIPRAERADALRQIVHFMGEQLLTLGVFYTVEPSLISSRMQHVGPRKVEDGRISWNAQEWDVQ